MNIPITTVKSMCREIIKAYTIHVREKVREGRKDYIETGIDEDINKYKEVFLKVLAITLGVKEEYRNTRLVRESGVVIKDIVERKEYLDILTKHRLMIYTTCEVMFEMVMKELANNEGK